MTSHKVADGYLLVLRRDELIVKSVTKFCALKNINAGYISGLGAVQSATVGYYYLKQKRYKFRKTQRLMEISSLTGNVAIKDGKPFLHLHVVLSDGKLRALGGHLKEAKVGGTCELYLKVFNSKLERQLDEDTGLHLLK